MRRADRIELAARRALDDPIEAKKGLSWYAEAQRQATEAARRSPIYTPEHVIGVLAALSPQQNWNIQLVWLPRILEAARADDPIPGPGFNANKIKARAILARAIANPLDILRGNKVRAFYTCIRHAGETSEVCIDRHALALAYGPGEVPVKITDKRYRETRAAFQEATARLRAIFPEVHLEHGLTPAKVQALTWCWWRDNPQERF